MPLQYNITSMPNAVFTYSPKDWKLKRALWFHDCEESGELIWPGTKAYHNKMVDVSLTEQRKALVKFPSPLHAIWLSPKSYMLCKLKGEA